MGDPGAEPRLVVPAGLVIDENVRERLERRLAVAPIEVNGIAAEIAEIAPGASYRVHNEWLSLSGAPLRPASSPVRGAVLLRPQVEFAMRDGSVDVPAGSVVVDPGAQVHDPRRAIGPLEPASDRGRPPFPRRPVVVFLACEPAADPDWLRRLVNRLVRHGIEARIAIPAPLPADRASPAVHLTRPSLAGEATIRALAPDVVVTLDRTAAAVIDGWCAGDRSTVVVDFDPQLPVPMELVSWQIDHASGRLRARIGPWVDVPAFASLVVRLCAGPQPIAPADEVLEARAPVLEHWTSRAASDSAPQCVVIAGALDASATARVGGLVDNLEAAGVPVAVSRHAVDGVPADVPAAALRSGLVVLAGLAPTPEIDALIDARRGAGLMTAVDLGGRDLEPAPADAPDAAPRLTVAAAALSAACDLVLSPNGAVRAAAAASGSRVLVLPTLLTRARAAALREARVPVDQAGVLVIGWRLAAGDAPPPSYCAVVGEAIATILTEHRDRVEIAGDAALVPLELRGHERVTVVPGGDVDPEVIARWAVHVWTPTLRTGGTIVDARLLEEASCAGVPSVLPADAAGGVDGFVSSHVLVESVGRTQDWYSALHHVLDDPVVRVRRAQEASRRADALDGPAASKAVVSRLMGLASYAADRDRART